MIEAANDIDRNRRLSHHLRPLRRRARTGFLFPRNVSRLQGHEAFGAGWPLLMSHCAPDRLRGLSVDADKCPSHVFRVTEPARLRDAFDRFDSRLYPASG